MNGFDLNAGPLTLGLFTGLTYALLAAGLVLVYRASRFINFAHAAVGLFGAAFVSLGVTQYGVSYWPALAFGVLVGAGVGALTEIMVVKPLADAPRVLSMVATLGMSTFLVVTALAVNPDGLSGLNFPQPSGMPTGSIGALRVTPAYAAQAILSPIALVALGVLLTRSRLGLSIRASASNPDAAATSGIAPRSTSLWAWAIAGGLATLAASFLLPSRGVVTPAALGPELLIRGLAAAAIARFASYPIAVATAVSIGVVEQLLATNADANGWIEVVILAAIMVSLLFDRRDGRAPVERWTDLGSPSRMPEHVRRAPLVRVGSVLVGAVALAAVLSVPWRASGSQTLAVTLAIGLAIVGVSVGIVTGLGGQLSLAQFGFAAIAAAVSVRIADASNLALGWLCGALSAAVVAVLVALPALRVRGPQLAVATLAFSIATASFLLDRDVLLGERRTPRRPGGSIDGIALSDSRGYYWVAVAALLAVLGLAHRLRSGAFARVLVAVRDNEDAARAMSLSTNNVKLRAAAIGGFVAGVGGVVYGHAFTTVSSANFPASASIDAVTATVIGGMGSLIGPVLGAFYLSAIPALFNPTPEALAGLSAAWLILIVSVHGGLAELLYRLRDRAFAVFLTADDDSRDDPAASQTDTVPHVPVAQRRPAAQPGSSVAPGDDLLVLEGVHRSFGGVRAVDDVSLTVRRGEIVGVVGPNGAGKTTLFELIGGFIRPELGRIVFDSRDVTGVPAYQRARQGVARTFQSALLFPSLTVTDAVKVALEAHHRSSFADIVITSTADRERRAAAEALVRTHGLTTFADVPIAALPTGTRRRVELVCALAQRPQLVLLDEPAAGIAQAETAGLVAALREIRATGTTVIIIEHDLALLGALCDRLIVMAAGAVIADGPPASVQSDPAVVEAYLGRSPGIGESL